MGAFSASMERLTARGYHATSVSRRDTSARWNCTPTAPDEEGFVDGAAIIVFDDQKPDVELALSVGDPVYLTGARKGRPAEIARIQAFYAGPDGHIWMRCRWFWRPETIVRDDNVEWHESELFLDTREEGDENSTCAIELTRVFVSEMADPCNFKDEAHTFFFRRTFDVKEEELSELPMDAPSPMETDVPDPAAPAGAPAGAPAPARPPRRNENKERLAALEDRWAQMDAKFTAQLESMKAHAAELEAKLEAKLASEVPLDTVTAMATRIAALELRLNAADA